MLCCKVTPPGTNDPDAIILKNDIKELFINKEKIVLLQIGANDGISADPIYDLIINESKIISHLVEPQTDAFDLLVKNYEKILDQNRIYFYKNAITHKNDKIKLYKNTAVNGTDGHSSLIIRDLDAVNGIVVADFKEEIFEYVDGITVDELVVKCNANMLKNNNNLEKTSNMFDVVVIDTEGYDLEIIKMLFNNNIYPKILFFESPGINGYFPEGDILLGDSAKIFMEEQLHKMYNVKYLQSNLLCHLKDV